jgi:NAD(P)H-nitrite reductase large subunit
MVMNTGLTIKQGLIVNNLMQTSIENIYAAGDVAQAPCQLTGELKLRALWPCAVQQGKVAGAAMAGKCEPYKGSIPMNSFHLFGLSVLSFGLIEGGADIEEQILQYPASGSYQKLLLQDGKLQGLIFVGDIQQAGTFYYKIGNTLERNESLRGSFSSFLCEPSRANTKR